MYHLWKQIREMNKNKVTNLSIILLFTTLNNSERSKAVIVHKFGYSFEVSVYLSNLVCDVQTCNSYHIYTRWCPNIHDIFCAQVSHVVEEILVHAIHERTYRTIQTYIFRLQRRLCKAQFLFWSVLHLHM